MKMKHIYVYIIILLIFLTSCGKQKKEWYLIKKIDDRTFIISEPMSSQSNSCFLILGSKEAILFDSGTRENTSKSITQITRSLTKLPITLLLSHFHFDHIGNISDFNRIGMPEIQLIKNGISVDSLIDLTKAETLTKSTLTLKISKLFPVGKDIDLGNRKIKILHTPGHSKESISIIDNENRLIFTGDLIYNGLLLLDDCNAYVKSIDEILEISDSKYRVFGSHGKPEVNYEQLVQIKKAIEIYLTDISSIKPIGQINLFGSAKDIYKIGDVSFIDGYTNVFNYDYYDK
jgi:hydroxyacylglutathione hydrolase